jgi:hypothetical protein
LLKTEIDSLQAKGQVDINEIVAYWDELRHNVVLDTETNEFVDLRKASNKLDLLKSIYSRKYQIMVRKIN